MPCRRLNELLKACLCGGKELSDIKGTVLPWKKLSDMPELYVEMLRTFYLRCLHFSPQKKNIAFNEILRFLFGTEVYAVICATFFF